MNVSSNIKENKKGSGYLKKIFLDNLPRLKDSKNKGNFIWKDSIGYKIKFIYDNIQGEIEIINYIDCYLYIKYLNKDIFKISTGHFRKCQLGKLLGRTTNEFKINLNYNIVDEKRNLIITDRKIKKFNRKDGNIENQKWYRYTCNKCGWTEGWILESALLKQNQGCSCCRGLTVVQGINDIPTTAPWMVKYFQGGYDEAKLYTKYSDKKIYPTCPDCGKIRDKKLMISNIYKQGISCPCGDGISYPEKIMFNVLEQLNINNIFQLNKVNFKWCDKYRYDFYFEINNEPYILETHGLQHYEDTNIYFKKLKEEQENDKTKKELALQNGIKEKNYIVIDCRYSDLEFIKNNVLHSKLNKLFDLNIINWIKVEEFALSNLVKKVCELKRDNNDLTVNEISKIMNLGKTTIRRYLKKGSNIWEWINYNGKEERKKNAIKVLKNAKRKNNKLVLCINTNQIFNSIGECERLSKEVLGIKLCRSTISRICNGKQNKSKGYKFKYIEGENINAI